MACFETCHRSCRSAAQRTAVGGARCSRAVHSEHCTERENEVACVKMALAPARTRRNGGPGLAPRHQCSSRGYLSLATMVTPWRYSDAVPWGPSDTHAAGMLHQMRIWRMKHALVPFRDDVERVSLFHFEAEPRKPPRCERQRDARPSSCASSAQNGVAMWEVWKSATVSSCDLQCSIHGTAVKSEQHDLSRRRRLSLGGLRSRISRRCRICLRRGGREKSAAESENY